MNQSKIISLLIGAGVLVAAGQINRIVYKRLGRKPAKAPKGEGYYSHPYGKARYTAAGEGENLLLVHGPGLGGGIWEWQEAADLSGRYRVYAVELPGFGFSQKPPVTYSAYYYASFINDFIQDIVGGKTYAASLGEGAVFLAGAAALKKDNFIKIALLNPGFEPGQAPLLSRAVKKLMETPILGDCLYNFLAAKRNIQKTRGETVSLACLDECRRAAHYGGRGAKIAYASYLGGHLRGNLKHMLRKAKRPVLILKNKEGLQKSWNEGMTQTIDFFNGTPR